MLRCLRVVQGQRYCLLNDVSTRFPKQKPMFYPQIALSLQHRNKSSVWRYIWITITVSARPTARTIVTCAALRAFSRFRSPCLMNSAISVQPNKYSAFGFLQRQKEREGRCRYCRKVRIEKWHRLCCPSPHAVRVCFKLTEVALVSIQTESLKR